MTEGGANGYTFCAMKRASLAILLLLALGGVGRTAMLCARSLCSIPFSVCCCHRVEHGASVRLARPMTCEETHGMAGDLHLSAPARACCTFSSAPTRTLGEAAGLRRRSCVRERWCALRSWGRVGVLLRPWPALHCRMPLREYSRSISVSPSCVFSLFSLILWLSRRDCSPSEGVPLRTSEVSCGIHAMTRVRA